MSLIKGDTGFAAWARQLQNDWRVINKFPIGTYKQKQKDGSILEVELGNYIEKKFAFDSGSNFLTTNIRKVVQDALKNKEKGAKITETRLYTNMLSSQPLAFNLFAELSLDLNLAKKFFQSQFKNRIENITNIIFEHSDGRGDCEYTCDHSAFDVFVEYKPLNGQNGFIAIEVKYSENLKDSPAKYKERYAELTRRSKIFKTNSLELLKTKPIEQIWRDHLLSISHLEHRNQKYDDGFFLYLFPEKNEQCQEAVDKYIEQFTSFDPSTKKYDVKETGFHIKHMKKFATELNELCKEEWSSKFLLRYFGEKE